MLYYVAMPESIFGDRPFLDPWLPFLTVADQFITTTRPRSRGAGARDPLSQEPVR
jgi:hypothetical protein